MRVKCAALAFVVIAAVLGTTILASPETGDLYDLHPVLDAEGKIRVPADLNGALADLRQMLDARLVERMQTGTEDDMASYHHGIGTWIRNNWGLWRGSRLATYFNGLGIFHPDDMSGIVFDSFWRELHGRPIDLDSQIAYYKEYWRQNSYPEKARCPEHRSRLEQYMSMPAPGSGQGLRTIHVFECAKRHETWVWEVDKGFYKPDAELLKAINED